MKEFIQQRGVRSERSASVYNPKDADAIFDPEAWKTNPKEKNPIADIEPI